MIKPIKKLFSVYIALLIVFALTTVGAAKSAELTFADTEGHWAVPYIDYVLAHGLMVGVEDGTRFAPNVSLNRAMAVTVLYRNAGAPTAVYRDVFIDVPDGLYYSDAVIWAYDHGIVSGTGLDSDGEPMFSPYIDITRQELALMFRRYAVSNNVAIGGYLTDISGYPDSALVEPWAKEAVMWSVGAGIINGKLADGEAYLAPLDTATRAEFAALISRYNGTEFEHYDDVRLPD